VKAARYIKKQNEEKQKHSLEEVSDLLSASLILPSPITLVRQECGRSTAFYNLETHEITLCYELDEELKQQATKKFGDTPTAKALSGAAFLFVLYHELGHAEIDLYHLNITGREEDVADQFATYDLLKYASSNGTTYIEGAMWFFSEATLSYTRQHLADVHSLNTQRQFNILCWAYGKDSLSFAGLAKRYGLTPERARGCQREYAQIAEAINALRLSESKRSPYGALSEYVDRAEIDRTI
jgi:hypothetical protein